MSFVSNILAVIIVPLLIVGWVDGAYGSRSDAVDISYKKIVDALAVSVVMCLCHRVCNQILLVWINSDFFQKSSPWAQRSAIHRFHHDGSVYVRTRDYTWCPSCFMGCCSYFWLCSLVGLGFCLGTSWLWVRTSLTHIHIDRPHHCLSELETGMQNFTLSYALVLYSFSGDEQDTIHYDPPSSLSCMA
jgi:hypothetical protein